MMIMGYLWGARCFLAAVISEWGPEVTVCSPVPFSWTAGREVCRLRQRGHSGQQELNAVHRGGSLRVARKREVQKVVFDLSRSLPDLGL